MNDTLPTCRPMFVIPTCLPCLMAGRRGGIFRYHLEDASFLGMTGGIVSMTKKICHFEPGFAKAFPIQENRVKDFIRNLFENGL